MRTKGEILDEIRWHASYFASCREIQQGIGSKDTVTMTRLIQESIDAGIPEKAVEDEYPHTVKDMFRFDYDLAVRLKRKE